jgi:hypothetical protein
VRSSHESSPIGRLHAGGNVVVAKVESGHDQHRAAHPFDPHGRGLESAKHACLGQADGRLVRIIMNAMAAAKLANVTRAAPPYPLVSGRTMMET